MSEENNEQERNVVSLEEALVNLEQADHDLEEAVKNLRSAQKQVTDVASLRESAPVQCW